MIKKVISLLVLIMYVHGLSGYTMNFHKCTITGFEKVYTSYSQEDPCGDENDGCQESSTQIDQADCCDIQQTSIRIDDNSDLSLFKIHFQQSAILFSFFKYNSSASSEQVLTSYSFIDSRNKTGPPEPSDICVFRI